LTLRWTNSIDYPPGKRKSSAIPLIIVASLNVHNLSNRPQLELLSITALRLLSTMNCCPPQNMINDLCKKCWNVEETLAKIIS